MAFTQAAGNSDLPEAEREANAALAIAEREAWLNMQYTIHQGLATVYMTEDQNKNALESFLRARSCADAIDEEDPERQPLRMQARLGLGALFIKQGDCEQALPHYAEASDVAAEADNHLMHVECRRMACYCAAQVKKHDDLWLHGQKGLAAGQEMAEDSRLNSTLPMLADSLLKNKAVTGDRERDTFVKTQLQTMLGSDWRQKIDQALAAAPGGAS